MAERLKAKWKEILMFMMLLFLLIKLFLYTADTIFISQEIDPYFYFSQYIPFISGLSGSIIYIICLVYRLFLINKKVDNWWLFCADLLFLLITFVVMIDFSVHNILLVDYFRH